MSREAIGLQAWVPRKDDVAPSAELFEPPSTSRASRKPLSGGLWTSTYDKHYGSDWIQWCLGESFGCDPDEPTFHIWTLEPDPAARIYEIDSHADLVWLCENYGDTHSYGLYSETYPDWSRLAEVYDAIHLTEEGQWATRLSEPNLYGWDCESTLWLRWCFGVVEDLGRVQINSLAEA